MAYVKGTQNKKVKGANLNVPGEKLKIIQESSAPSDVKMSHLKMYDSAVKMNKYDKDMMHERELIYDAKKEIHKEDVAKKHHDHVVSRIAGRKSRM
jgi:hypothetical protein